MSGFRTGSQEINYEIASAFLCLAAPRSSLLPSLPLHESLKVGYKTLRIESAISRGLRACGNLVRYLLLNSCSIVKMSSNPSDSSAWQSHNPTEEWVSERSELAPSLSSDPWTRLKQNLQQIVQDDKIPTEVDSAIPHHPASLADPLVRVTPDFPDHAC